MGDQDQILVQELIRLVPVQQQAPEFGLDLPDALASVQWRLGFVLELGEGQSGERHIRSEFQPRGQELFAPERHGFVGIYGHGRILW